MQCAGFKQKKKPELFVQVKRSWVIFPANLYLLPKEHPIQTEEY